MATRSWTELFFLDEATALAAGHRPCFYCRRDDANAFRAAWERGNCLSGVRAPEMDEVLHTERLDGKAKRLHALPVTLDELPDGAMVQAEGESYLIVRGQPQQWSFEGYRKIDFALHAAKLITPPSTIRALRAGYGAVLHGSAG
jgi:hypothetical protein